MNAPREFTISIDRRSKSWAVFEDSFQIVKPFEKYTDEELALAKAIGWCFERSDLVPEVVFPKLNKIRIN